MTSKKQNEAIKAIQREIKVANKAHGLYISILTKQSYEIVQLYENIKKLEEKLAQTEESETKRPQ